MTAGPFVLDELLKRVHPGARKWLASKILPERRRKLEIAIIIFGVFYAGFLAFKEEHAKCIEAEAKAAAQSPAGIAEMRLELEDLKSEKAAQKAKEWMPLTDEQIEEWAKALAPYKIERITVYWAQTGDGIELYRSLKKVGEKIKCKVDGGNSGAPANEIDVFSAKKNKIGYILKELFGNLYPDATVKLAHERNTMPTPELYVDIFIGEKQ